MKMSPVTCEVQLLLWLMCSGAGKTRRCCREASGREGEIILGEVDTLRQTEHWAGSIFHV